MPQNTHPAVPTAWARLLRARRWLLVAPLLLLGLVLLRAPQGALADTDGGEIRLLTIDGVISPTTARYLERELDAAARAEAPAVILVLDTPGGLERSMREMTTAILGSQVPVVVWVAPSGARAASAGMFITVSAHVAAMAPGTSIGAAHPVPLGGGEMDATVESKITEDAAAFARSLAALRGRNAEWVERAVVDSVAASAEEALELTVIDLVARDLDALLAEVHGWPVSTPRGDDSLSTRGAPVVERPMVLSERILQAITDPNVAYILFTLGVIGLVAELYSPGTLFPGIAGLISLVLAFVAFGSLPVSGAGLALLLLGLGLFVADLYSEGLGILAVGGLVAFVVGSLMLYQPLTVPSPAMPVVSVSPWLIAGLASIVTGFFLIVLRALFRSRREPIAVGAQALEGRIGVAMTDLAPRGRVRVDSEIWSATSDRPIQSGSQVEVLGVEGVTLRVRQA